MKFDLIKYYYPSFKTLNKNYSDPSVDTFGLVELS